VKPPRSLARSREDDTLRGDATQPSRHERAPTRAPQPATHGATPVNGPAAGTRADRILLAVVGFYVAVLVAMVAFDRYVFLVKSLIVPILVLAALVSGRFKRFVNDWAVFLGLVVFFDFCRGLTYAAVTHFELPMYLDYALRWERWLCGGAIAPETLQHLRAGLSNPVWLDRFFVLVYSSHYLFFLVFGFVIWYARRDAFRTYIVAIMALIYSGLVVYFLVPTIPPWAAANEFFVIPPIVQVVRPFYNLHLPQLVAAFDVNPFAAMPSLHAALPAICALLALRYFRGWGLPVVLYAVAVWVAVLYLGEHYLVDVVAGCVLALSVFAAAMWWEARFNAVTASRREPQEGWAVRSIAFALLLAALAVGLGQLNARWTGPLPITRAFIQRELMGRSILAHYYLGRVAFTAGDFAEAQVELTRSLDDLVEPSQQKVIRAFLGSSASHTRDFPAVIAALEPLRAVTDDVSNLVLLANAYVETNQYDQGLAVLREARSRFPTEPEPPYWLARYRYQHGEIDRNDVTQVIEVLRQFPQERAAPLRRSLSEVLQQGGDHAFASR